MGGTSREILFGTANPTNSQGAIGDYYLQSYGSGNSQSGVAHAIWEKTSNTNWALRTRFSVLASGTATPSGNDFDVRTWYIKRDSNGVATELWTRYSSGTWNMQGTFSQGGGGGIRLSFGTGVPSGGSQGDVYFQYETINNAFLLRNIYLRGSNNWVEQSKIQVILDRR